MLLVSQNARHILKKQHRINGIVRSPTHPAHKSAKKAASLSKGLFDPHHPAAGTVERRSQFGSHERFGDGPDEGQENEAKEGIEIASGEYGRFDAEGTAGDSIED
mmetsp:Transcript_29973/g.63088  ORF Transcript_29973/g.63088 Transcript_29973/m.63088 type:complete len:105 (-) Transcript_29973:278-592(-)